MTTERLLQSHSHSHFNFDQRKQKITICRLYCHHDTQRYDLLGLQPLLVHGDEVGGVGGGHPGAVQPRSLLRPIAAQLVGIRPIGGQQCHQCEVTGGRYYVELQTIHRQQSVFTFTEKAPTY